MTHRTFLVLIIGAGALVRLVPLVGAGFPLNDGGLFLAMAQDLQNNGFVLPAHASYNDLAVPFAYPPLGFYLAAATTGLTGLSGLDVLRIVPLAASLATIPVVFAIARQLFRDDRMALSTAAFCALTPRSYHWLIAGGGITRAPGFLLALVAIFLAMRMYTEGGRLRPYFVGLILGIAALFHPQAGLFGALSLVVLLPFVADDRRVTALALARVAATAILVTIPWLATIVVLHGPGPILSAAATAGSPIDGLLLLAASSTSDGYFEVMGIATSLGLIVCILRRFWLPPVWLIAVVLIDPRAGLTFATVPAAMAVTFLLRDIGRVVARAARDVPTTPRTSRGPVTFAVLFALLATGVGVDSVASGLDPGSPLRALGADEREAMSWVAAETDPDARFLVISGAPWVIDAESEWFPVLARRESIGTVQGYEWLGAGRFKQQRERAEGVLECAATSDLTCLESVIGDFGGVDYLFLTNSPVLESLGFACCLELAMDDDTVVFRNDAVVILRWEGT